MPIDFFSFRFSCKCSVHPPTPYFIVNEASHNSEHLISVIRLCFIHPTAKFPFPLHIVVVNFFLGGFSSLAHEKNNFFGQLQDVESERVELSGKKNTKSIPNGESLSFKSPENVFIITYEP